MIGKTSSDLRVPVPQNHRFLLLMIHIASTESSLVSFFKKAHEILRRMTCSYNRCIFLAVLIITSFIAAQLSVCFLYHNFVDRCPGLILDIVANLFFASCDADHRGIYARGCGAYLKSNK